jgi:hypothetical protein
MKDQSQELSKVIEEPVIANPGIKKKPDPLDKLDISPSPYMKPLLHGKLSARPPEENKFKALKLFEDDGPLSGITRARNRGETVKQLEGDNDHNTISSAEPGELLTLEEAATLSNLWGHLGTRGSRQSANDVQQLQHTTFDKASKLARILSSSDENYLSMCMNDISDFLIISGGHRDLTGWLVWILQYTRVSRLFNTSLQLASKLRLSTK